MNATLTFAPDGTGYGLYTEVIDLHALGRLSVERATTIEFDNNAQQWRVRDIEGQPLFAAVSRRECLEWERKHFDSQTGPAACPASGPECTRK